MESVSMPAENRPSSPLGGGRRAALELLHGGETHEAQATLVVEKRGITRMDPGIARDAFAPEWPDRAAEDR